LHGESVVSENVRLSPDLAAILIAGELRERAGRSLRRLLAQTIIDRMEILVADLCPEAGPLSGADHPPVRSLALPRDAYYCQAQSAALHAARAPIVAFIEDHSYASPGWAEAVLDAFAWDRVAAVNYTFTPAASGYLSRSILMAEYGYWMTPHPGGAVRFASSTNIAYRRELLLKYLPDEAAFEAEFLLHRALEADGRRIVVAPGALVAHESWSRLGDACLANGANKRALGARRAALGNWSVPRKTLMALAMAAMPAFGILRLARSLRHRPALWGTFLAGLPIVASIYTYSAVSEAMGYLFGPGRSREEFRARELAVTRDG
jgi:hypothetical protein